ncbi:MAG: ATP-binding cassette domain-containing protein [Desulfovibrio sp.]|jgi:molybdate transport system ATP-binding protein|nr:ATP-binding cassette domain-containing protein [Desulfovibrio sp.]
MITVRLEKAFPKGVPPFSLSVDYTFTAEQPRAVLFGPSGSGKSLTLRCLAGLMKPDRGLVRVADHVLLDSAGNVSVPARHRRIGYMFQEYALFPHLNVLENVAYSHTGNFPRFMRSDVREKARGMLERFSVGHLAERMPGTLSGGQRQRVALARALNADPLLLMLDEPFSALDTILRERLREELADMLEKLTIPVIMITHDPEDVDFFADVLVLYNHGRATPVPDYRRMRRHFPTASACLRHLQRVCWNEPEGEDSVTGIAPETADADGTSPNAIAPSTDRPDGARHGAPAESSVG